MSHGDYVAGLEVDALSTTGDGIHFSRLTDALAVARAGRMKRNELERADCRITIVVAAGTFKGSTAASSDAAFERFPLVIDVPDLTLRGALKMQVDAGGRATGVSTSSTATIIVPGVLLGGSSLLGGPPQEPMVVVNGHPDGSKGFGAVVEGFVFQSGRLATDTTFSGTAFHIMRVRDVVIRGNKFEGGFNEWLDPRSSSVLIERNHFSGSVVNCGICLAGPGHYVVRDNRMIGGGNAGINQFPAVHLNVSTAVEPFSVPAAALISSVISNNEVRGNLRKPAGAGIRIGAIGINASDVVGTNLATLTGNTLTGNIFGLVVHAPFVQVGTARRGDIEVTTSGNTIAQNCQNEFFVSLTAAGVGLGIGAGPSLLNSTFRLTLGTDVQWDKAWFAHPANAGNKLLVNGGGERFAHGV